MVNFRVPEIFITLIKNYFPKTIPFEKIVREIQIKIKNLQEIQQPVSLQTDRIEKLVQTKSDTFDLRTR